MNKIIIIGAGGHATSCIDVIESENKYKILGLIDNKKNLVESKRKYKIIGVDKDLHKIRKEIKYVHIGIAHLGNVKNRNQIIKNLNKLKFDFPTIRSKNAYISETSVIHDGSIIMHGCVVNSFVKIDKFTIINTGSIIEHDVKIGKNCHIAPGVIINGGANIGDNVFVGSGSIIYQGIKIPKNSIIPALSIVNKHFSYEKK